MQRRDFLVGASALALAPTPLLGTKRVEAFGSVPPAPLKSRLSIPTTGGVSLQRFMVEYQALKERAATARRHEAAYRSRIPYDDLSPASLETNPDYISASAPPPRPPAPTLYGPGTETNDPFKFWHMRRDNIRKQNHG